VAVKRVFWGSPGEYLGKSTLLSLRRSISGFELPPLLYEDIMFTSEETTENNDYDLELSMYVRGALIETFKEGDKEETDNKESDETMSDVEEADNNV
jgi:hypothetical protein